MEIRKATEADVPVVLAMVKELAAYERLSKEVSADEETLRRSLFGERPAAEAIIGWCGAEPVGFAVFFTNFSTFLGLPGLYLEDLYVRPERRRCGYGKALLQFVAQEAVRRGCGRFEWAVLDWNRPAITFYESLGAVPMSDWTVYRLAGDALRRTAEGNATRNM